MDNPILLLDGGLSNELNPLVSFDVHAEPLWTAKALQADPKAVTAVHLAYLKGIVFGNCNKRIEHEGL